MIQGRRGTNPGMRTSKRMPGVGVALGWSGTRGCGKRCSLGSSRAGHRSRCRDGWPWSQAVQSSPTRAYTGSSTARWLVRRTTAGATTYPEPSRSVVGGVAKGAALLRSWLSAVPLQNVPRELTTGRPPAHWEADLMLFRTYGHAVLTMHERHSRILIAFRPPGKASGPIAAAMSQVLGQFPPEWRRTVTFDNGTEFAHHYQLHDLGIETFFCDTYSPWQKGGVENAIGRLRRTLPRKTDLATLSDDRFTQLIQAYNNTPRKCLDYRTPAEIFLDRVLHLKCESTCPPARARRARGIPAQLDVPIPHAMGREALDASSAGVVLGRAVFNRLLSMTGGMCAGDGVCG